PRRSGPPEAGMQRYRLEVGRRDGVRPGNIVGAVANEAGIEGEFIGPITINDSYSTIDLPEGMPSDIYQSLQRTRVVGKPLQIKLDDGKRREGSSEEDGRPRRHEGGRGPGKGKRRGPAKGKSHGKKDGGFQQSQFSKPAKAKKKGKKKHKKNPSS
ncbi:MAG: DbpA RNA binding domain-containing protein, partial [Rubripirellula sp.]